jgi:hypothetical protein
MQRGITLIDIKSGASVHTGDDWDLIMSGKVIANPDPRVSKIDMTDRDGEIDQSEVIRGRVSYKNRALSFSFICTAHQSTWADLRSEIAGFVHGKQLMIIDPDTPDHYYIGRCTLGEPSYKGAAIMFLDIAADVYPYRLSITDTTVAKSVSAGDSVELINGGMAVVPTIEVSADMTISFGSQSASLTRGSVYQIPEITLESGVNVITITAGSGTITFKYRQGAI